MNMTLCCFSRVDVVILQISTFSALKSLMGLVTCHFPCTDCLPRQGVWQEVKDFLMVPQD